MEQQDASFTHERSVATSRPALNSPRLARLERPDHAVSLWYRHIVDKGKRIIAVVSAGHVGRDKTDLCARGIPGGLLPHLPSPHAVLPR
jgi:hypothetical protein